MCAADPVTGPTDGKRDPARGKRDRRLRKTGGKSERQRSYRHEAFGGGRVAMAATPAG